ncbi:hypothetical protein MXB_3115 [Myxobolus squamalis]|nr:hypothetical protein MXB_3115 [Myxobolus squamalis]
MHWVLIVICYPSNLNNNCELDPSKCPQVLLFDSLKIFEKESLFVQWQWYMHTSADFEFARQIKGIVPDVIGQTNSKDCGIFLLQYAESFLKGKPTNQARLPKFDR